MAITAERMIAILEAKIDNLEKGVNRAAKTTETAMGRIQAAGTGAEKTLMNIGARGTPGLDRLNKSLGRSRAETANVAAQFQDIGVQLAGGQSPFLIAIQQGTQLNQVLGQQGARGALSLLAGGFASLLNPVSLATIAIIGLGGTAIQYFAEMLSNAQKSEEALQKQIDLIRQVADRWGDAVPALRDYIAELDNAKTKAEALAAGQGFREQLFDPLKEAAADLTIEVADFVSQLQQAGLESPAIDELQDAFLKLRERIDANEATASDTKRAQEALNAAMALGVGDASSLNAALSDLSGILAEVAERAAEADRQIAKVTTRESQGGRVRYQSGQVELPGTAPTPDRRVDPYFEDPNPGASRSAASERERAAHQAEREQEAIARLVEQLEFELQMLGATDEQRRVQTALRQAGAAATEEQRARIAHLVTEIDREREALKASEEAMKEVNDLARDFMQGFASDLMNGVSAADALTNALQRLASRLMDSAFDSIFNGGGGGGILSLLGIGNRNAFPAAPSTGVGLYHGGGVAGHPRSSRNVSPSIFAGAPRYHSGGIAGIRPDEVPAILQRGEVVLPRGAGMGSGRQAVDVRVSVDNDGNMQAYVQKESRRQAAGVVTQAAPAIVNASKASTFKELGRGGADGILGARYGVRPQTARKT